MNGRIGGRVDDIPYDVCRKKNTNASRRQEFFRRWTVSLESGTLCQSHSVTEIPHLCSLRNFWRHLGLCSAAAHSDCCFFATCTNILTYLLTYLLVVGGIETTASDK